MALSSLESLKIKAKLLQKAKKKAGLEVPLKDAYQSLARAAGYATWAEMKTSYYLADIFNPPQWSAQWKIWFSSKEEALLHFKEERQYLLPYRHQFFLCDGDYLESLGISVADPDLKLVGHDWTSPLDREAFKRLIEKIKQSQAKLK